MLTIIVLDDMQDRDAVARIANRASEIPKVAEVVAISAESDGESSGSVRWIRAPLANGLLEAAAASATKRIVVLSSALDLTDTALASAIEEIDSASLSSHFVIPFSMGVTGAEETAWSAESIMHRISASDTWPLLGVGVSRAFITSAALENVDESSAIELLARALILAAGQGDSISATTEQGAILSEGIADALCGIGERAACRILETAVDAFNIEELFPNLAWQSFPGESAALAYHSLAALFIRFGDLEAANQALGCAERLEESPRYFALKGFIARDRGETLGAVANLVSSLQCYESRKKDTGQHYLSFSPSNLEVINSKLVEGLNALNRRDNETALEHFSDAVFSFDSFYSQYGVKGRQ